MTGEHESGHDRDGGDRMPPGPGSGPPETPMAPGRVRTTRPTAVPEAGGDEVVDAEILDAADVRRRWTTCSPRSTPWPCPRPARRVPRLAAAAAGRVRELQEAGGQATDRPGGPGRRLVGGEGPPGARHPRSGHRTTSATPSRPTGGPCWRWPASCTTYWPKRASSGSTRWARRSTPMPTRRSARCRPRTRASAGDGADGRGAPAAAGEPVVAQVMRPGYRWRGTVVRPAMVMVRG